MLFNEKPTSGLTFTGLVTCVSKNRLGCVFEATTCFSDLIGQDKFFGTAGISRLTSVTILQKDQVVLSTNLFFKFNPLNAIGNFSCQKDTTRKILIALQ